jgi:hypothetical protein
MKLLGVLPSYIFIITTTELVFLEMVRFNLVCGTSASASRGGYMLERWVSCVHSTLSVLK